MPELLFMKYDHSTDPDVTATQAAQLPRPFDLIDWKPDGWDWGSNELSNPWFRIVSWADAPEAACDAMLSPEMPEVDQTDQPTTVLQFRGQCVNLADQAFLSQLPTVLDWWGDDTRAQPIFVVPPGFSLDIASVTVQRPPVAGA